MRKINDYFSLWQSLLTVSVIIIIYLYTIHLKEALSYFSMATYFNQENAHISWEPSKGAVDHYLLEITDTHFLSGTTGGNALTTVKYLSSKYPFYQLSCEHNHSYKVRVKAVSSSGISSAYSEASVLFICDLKKPEIIPPTLPSPQKVRSPSFLLTGNYEEPHLSSITVNGKDTSINPVDKSFKAKLKLELGENRIDIRAQDLAGNTGTKGVHLNYAPLTIISNPSDARLYWNGNHAYLGIYSGNTPRSYNQTSAGKQVIRLTYPGFNDYYGIIDFSDLSKDSYIISLLPFLKIELEQVVSINSQGKEIEMGTHSHPFVVDYDLDGRKNLLVGTNEGNIALFTNSGKDNTPTFSGYNFLKAEGEDIDVGTHAAPFTVDYNNDGAKDLLVGNGEGDLLYYANRGSNTHPIFSSPIMLEDSEGSLMVVDSYCKPWVVDWNEDHKKDILMGSGSGTLTLYLNQGSDSAPLFASPRSIEVEGKELAAGSFSAPFVADLNGDGVKDLLVGNGEGYVFVYLGSEAEGKPQLSKAEKVQLNGQELMLEGFAVPFLIDWNQDGKKELLLGSGDGRIYLSM